MITYEDDFKEHTSVEELNLMVNSKNGSRINNIVLISLFSLIGIGLYYFKKKEE
ncbi:MAG: hypothetical protein U9P81_02980 [Euryarchaeota archaeon]|nr:hypothetical protein [Euryarchaeota archaeon]